MKQENRPFLIAITGGIASGKSTVSGWFEKQGFTVHYADKIGHELLNDVKVLKTLNELFGPEILIDGIIDREKLGNYVFSNPNSLKKLNSVLHPAIRRRMQDLIEQSKEKIIFFEIPLLFEGGLETSFDLVVNVHVSLENQIKRLIIRNKFTRLQAENRINSQLATENKIALADVNVDNNKTTLQLRNQLERLISNLDSYSKKEVVPLI